MQRNFDKSFGFNAFPYTHGDGVEKARESATKKWREEIVTELEKKGTIVSREALIINSNAALQKKEEELKEKAKSLTEAKRKHKFFYHTNSFLLWCRKRLHVEPLNKFDQAEESKRRRQSRI